MIQMIQERKILAVNDAMRKTKCLLVIVPLVLALLSATVVAGVATDPSFHQPVIAALEEKQTTVLELTAAATAASAAVTLLPGDAATPIAEKLADLSSGFLVVLCAIYLEKYLLTITGCAAFRFLIPAACVLLAASAFWRREQLRALAGRLVIFSLAIVLVIPVSVGVSDLIEDTYQASIQAALERAKETTAEVEDNAGETEEDQGLWEGLLSKVTEGVTGVTAGITEKVSDMVNGFLEALAVLLVTACVIPLLVLAFFVWLVKLLFHVRCPAGSGARDAFRVRGQGSADAGGDE